MLIFVDESGSFLCENGQEYFVIASFTVGDPKRTAKAFRSWQASKFPFKKKTQSEIKFSDSGISPVLRIKTIKQISQMDVRIRFGFFKCKNISEEYFKNDRIREGYLYTQIVGEVIESYFPVTDKDVQIFCDARHLRGMKKSEFKEILQARLLPVASTGTSIIIKQVDSTTDKNIQIVDWIAGALAAKLNGKPYGKEYEEILRANIIGEPVELFKDRFHF
jgi:hypothetical protein